MSEQPHVHDAHCRVRLVASFPLRDCQRGVLHFDRHALSGGERHEDVRAAFPTTKVHFGAHVHVRVGACQPRDDSRFALQVVHGLRGVPGDDVRTQVHEPVPLRAPRRCGEPYRRAVGHHTDEVLARVRAQLAGDGVVREVVQRRTGRRVAMPGVHEAGFPVREPGHLGGVQRHVGTVASSADMPGWNVTAPHWASSCVSRE